MAQIVLYLSRHDDHRMACRELSSGGIASAFLLWTLIEANGIGYV